MFENLSPMLWLHFTAVSAALGIGAWQVIGRKGGDNHRRAGWLYVIAMLLGNFGALNSYRLGINLFHVFAIVSLCSLFFGLRAMRRWRATGAAEWLHSHRINMGYSYLGLVMAGVSQFLTNPRFGLVPEMGNLAFWGVFAVVNIIMYALGSWLIFRNARTGGHAATA
ncbi:MAG: hypothetical protein CFE37_07060 [Alphaproteobacteria bacterium PA4]|nr:MAG: hypothetical protein CFE37_07060 [Alphaproteobacteria bacterium PA4]